MDYYATLGIQRNASDAEIKKAYRSMAMKYHPDRGGDEKKFKEISQAYEYLSDPQKKQIIDLGGDPNAQQGAGGFGQSPFEFHFNSGNMNDIFGNFGFGGFGRQPQRRNRSLNVNVEITLEDVLSGKDFTAEVSIPGKNKMINIQIPPGIEHGQQIRYEGMGDDSIPGLKPGDLLVNIVVREHGRYRREGTSLIIEREVSVWDALLGASIEIQTLDRKTLSMSLPSGTQPDTVMSCKGEGLPNMRTRQRGNLLIRIKVIVPKLINPEQINLIQQIKQGISND
jgi:DnaJ-class molecular chaperone